MNTQLTNDPLQMGDTECASHISACTLAAIPTHRDTNPMVKCTPDKIITAIVINHITRGCWGDGYRGGDCSGSDV